jgi:hypothetical protein
MRFFYYGSGVTSPWIFYNKMYNSFPSPKAGPLMMAAITPAYSFHWILWMHGLWLNIVSDCKAISCFFSVLRQFKIVKPTRQLGDKTNKLWKTKLSLHVVWMWNITKIWSISFFLQKKSSTKCKIRR